MSVIIDAHAHLTWRAPGSDWEARDRSLIDAALERIEEKPKKKRTKIKVE